MARDVIRIGKRLTAETLRTQKKMAAFLEVAVFLENQNL